MDELSGIRVLIADDSAPWRAVVAAQLRERSMDVVGTAADGIEAVDKARTLRPDMIIMDIWMPRLNGLAATREICACAAAPGIVVVSSERDVVVVDAAFAAGARGYVLKSLAGSDLLLALAAMVRGERFVSRGLAQH